MYIYIFIFMYMYIYIYRYIWGNVRDIQQQSTTNMIWHVDLNVQWFLRIMMINQWIYGWCWLIYYAGHRKFRISSADFSQENIVLICFNHFVSVSSPQLCLWTCLWTLPQNWLVYDLLSFEWAGGCHQLIGLARTIGLAVTASEVLTSQWLFQGLLLA